MLTADEVAEKISVDVNTVRGWCASGQLRAFNVAKSPTAKKPRWRIQQADLDAFLDRRANGSAAAPTSAPARTSRARTRDAIQFF